MSELEKLLLQHENETSEAMIAENAAKDVRAKIVEAILAGETTGDYVSDIVLAMDLPDEEARVLIDLQRQLLGAEGKLVMVVERWFEYREVVYGSNVHLKTSLSFGVLTEPRFYVALSRQEKSIVRGPWYLPVRYVCRFFPDKNDASVEMIEKLSAVCPINYWLAAILFSPWMYDVNNELSKRESLDMELLNGNGPKPGDELCARHLRFYIGEEEVFGWAKARNDRRVQQVQEACRLLEYSKVIPNL